MKHSKNYNQDRFISHKGVLFDPFIGYISNSKEILLENEEKTDIELNIDEPPFSKNSQGFIFVLTTKCNLNCEYCYSITQNKPLSMKIQDPVNILRKNIKKDTQTVFVNFFGGEPTLEIETIRNTVEYLKKLELKNIFLRISTNGTLNKEDLDYLVDNNFSIILSSDGKPNKEDELSKRRVAEKVEKNIKQLVKRNATFRIRCTVTNSNLKDLPESISYWKTLGVDHVHLEPYHPIGTSEEELKLLPDANEFIKYFKLALDKAEEHEIWIQNGIYMNLLTPSTYFCTGAAGKFRIYNPDGSITSCYRVQSFQNKISNFYIGDWKKDLNNNKHRINPYRYNEEKLLNHSINDMNKCSHCKAKYICGGGCLMRNLTQGGSINSPDKWICKVRLALLNDAIIRTWHAIKENKRPVVFGRYVYETNVLNNPSLNNLKVKNTTIKDNIDFKRNQSIFDIYEIIGIDKNLKNNDLFKKISRAECL